MDTKIEIGKTYTDGATSFVIKNIVVKVTSVGVKVNILIEDQGDQVVYRVGADNEEIKKWKLSEE